MEKGDILRGRGAKAIHPIIFLQDKNSDFFIGAMLTTSNQYPENILMKAEHFEEFDSKGERHELYFNNSHFVKAKLLKRNEWAPFRMVGKLTEEGIKFVESNVNTEYEKLWEDFLSEK